MYRQFSKPNWDSVKVLATIRPLGSFEHMLWLLDQNRPCHFAMTAQIAGTASPDHWREALDRVQGRHPLLSVCIEGSPGSIPCFRQEDAAPIPLRIVEGDPKTHWEREVGEELATPFDANRAPLIRAVLIQGSRDTAFILVAHHSIADGLSLAYAIRDTLSTLSGELLEPLPLAPAQEEILGVGAGSAALADTHEQPDGTPVGKPSTYRPLDDARPVVKGLRLPRSLTARLRDRARQEGTTVHGALCAAFVIAGRQVSAGWRDSALRILSPINTRPLLEVGESCGVFVSATTSTLDGQAVGFWELARDAKAAIAIEQTRDSVMASLSTIGEVVGKGAEIATAANVLADAFAHEGVLTNLGVLPFDNRFGALTLENMWGPAVQAGMEGEQTIGVATVNGSICLTHTSHTPLEGLLEAMRSVLVDALSMHTIRPIDGKPTCRVVRAGAQFAGKQGHLLAPGISAQSVGARRIHLQIATIPPGSQLNAHKHADHETAIYGLSGESGVWYGEKLEQHLIVRAGDFLYIPANLPHLPYNLSQSESCVAVIARTDPDEQESVVLLPELDAVHEPLRATGPHSSSEGIVETRIQQ
jgi:uncharacterized RmlC-like cupin family protein